MLCSLYTRGKCRMWGELFFYPPLPSTVDGRMKVNPSFYSRGGFGLEVKCWLSWSVKKICTYLLHFQTTNLEHINWHCEANVFEPKKKADIDMESLFEHGVNACFQKCVSKEGLTTVETPYLWCLRFKAGGGKVPRSVFWKQHFDRNYTTNKSAHSRVCLWHTRC